MPKNNQHTKVVNNMNDRIWLATSHMSDEGYELEYIQDAFAKGWVAPLGENVNEFENAMGRYLGKGTPVALSAGTAALHLSMILSGVKAGDQVFCQDLTFSASANPIAYLGAEPVFIDSERDTWNMDPAALEKAFALYGKPAAVVAVHLYGNPAKMDEICAICEKHNVPLIEDAAEALTSTSKASQCGTFGDFGVLSFNGNKIITTSGGGMLICKCEADAKHALKLATQAREPFPWYQHEEIGYNYRMSNIIAGIVRGQLPYLDKHIAQKKAIYERYKAGLADLPVRMNPFDEENSQPNFWLSCLIIDEDAMAPMVRGEQDYLYKSEPGKSSPHEILDALSAFNAEGRPIWKPMHMQPIYRTNAFITTEGNGRGRTNAYISGSGVDVGADIFRRGLCLPSDNKMTPEQQDRIIEIIHRCFL